MHSTTNLSFASLNVAGSGRYQIFCSSRGGKSSLTFSADSDAEIVEAFMLQVPQFNGGDIRVWDQSQQVVVALVKWKNARTELGLSVLQRVNIFHDWHFALIACDFLKQRRSSDPVEMRF